VHIFGLKTSHKKSAIYVSYLHGLSSKSKFYKDFAAFSAIAANKIRRND
jgi:hypothetical protein